MTGVPSIEDQIFALREHNDVAFDRLAMELFMHHAAENETYGAFVEHLGVNPKSVSSVEDIPFLPIELFKRHTVGIFDGPPEAVFLSSGTTGSERSSHHVADLSVYDRSLSKGFHTFFGNPKEYCILGLLPSYIDRSNASLAYMARKLMELSGHPDNGFYLDRLTSLSKVLKRNADRGQRTLLIGVTFALLDLAAKHPCALPHCTIIETGGMKGRRREMVREEVHGILRQAFQMEQIGSEYGMTELLSQAWSMGEGIFHTPPWMRVTVRDSHDPLARSARGRGAINVIDLANLNSCPFIATQDIGEVYQDGSFTVLGRLDSADVRGCSQMVL